MDIGSRGPWRRAVFISMLSALVCAWAWSVAGREWFAFQSAQAQEAAAANLPRTASLTNLTSLSAWDLTQPGTGGNPLRQAPALAEVAGVPLPLLLLAAAAMLAVVGVLMRSAILPVVGILVANFARSLVVAAEAGLETSAFTGPYITATRAPGEFAFICWLMLGLMVTLSLQVAYANYRQRKARAAAGVPEASFMDSLWSVQTAGLNRLAAPAHAQPAAPPPVP